MDEYAERNLKMARAYTGESGSRGKTLLQVAEEFGLTRQRTHQILLKMGVKMDPRGRRRGGINEFKCKRCGKPFVSQNKNRSFCSRACSHMAMRKYKTKAEKEMMEKKRKEKAAERAKIYYHKVFKSKDNWRDIVHQRNMDNIAKRKKQAASE